MGFSDIKRGVKKISKNFPEFLIFNEINGNFIFRYWLLNKTFIKAKAHLEQNQILEPKEFNLTIR